MLYADVRSKDLHTEIKFSISSHKLSFMGFFWVISRSMHILWRVWNHVNWNGNCLWCTFWVELFDIRMHSKAVLPLRRRDCDSIKKSRLLVEPSGRNGASPTSVTTMRWRFVMNQSVVEFFLDRIAVASPQWENGLMLLLWMTIDGRNKCVPVGIQVRTSQQASPHLSFAISRAIK
jgi:hypothetical protein